jgi:AraC-like DNA-binding protein
MPLLATVSARGLRALLHFAHQRGVNSEIVLAEAGVDHAIFADTEARLPRERWAAVWRVLEGKLGDPAIAVHLAYAIPFGAFDVLDYVAVTSPTIGEGIIRASRYFRLVHDQVNLEIEGCGEFSRIHYRFAGESFGADRYSSEFTLACVVVRLRHSSGVHWSPREVHFRHPAPRGDLAPYRDLFECEVRFGMPSSQIVVDSSVLELPNKGADALLNTVLQRHATTLLQTLPETSSIVEAVRAELRRAFVEGEPTIESVARALALSPRTMQRRLREEDATFNEVLDDERRALAQRFLGDSRMGIAEVGFLLGFSDPSAFHRAFRRWTGQTPGDFRRAALH